MPTNVTDADSKQLQELILNIPEGYLEIFKGKPYSQFEWIKILRKSNYR